MRNILIVLVFLAIACKSEKTINSPSPVVEKNEELESPMIKESFHTVDYVTGRFDPSTAKDFVSIPIAYADREGQYMREDAFKAFQQMFEAAQKDGIKLVIRSAARNFTYQKGIWERKWTGNRILSDGTDASKMKDEVQRSLKILEYSSMPGSSRHHWGTDIDLNSFENEWFEKDEGLKIYQWLSANANKYGYCQVYCEKGPKRTAGYNEEKWHYSYMPKSEGLLSFAKEHLNISDIKGFKGDHTAGPVGIIEKYIMGINNTCQH